MCGRFPIQFLLLLWLCIQTRLFVTAQGGPPTPAQPQDNTYNAENGSPLFTQAQSILQHYFLSNASKQALQTAVDFERTNWAGAKSVKTDPFYQLPHNASTDLPAGSILKHEAVNASDYTIASELALCRILYTTKNVNGTVIPASGSVLWPYMPRSTRVKGMPVVGWAHGTSGITAECAPSHVQNLWYQFNAPFVLALQGYVVVAPDYAGLGIDSTVDGHPIVHQWGANPAAANDLVYAVQAAQAAWPDRLSKEFVIMGHSEGGGAAWGLAQEQFSANTPGYLGAVAGSPITQIAPYAKTPLSTPGFQFEIALLASTVSTIYPSFELSQWLTPRGIELLNVYKALNGCQAAAQELFYTPGNKIANTDWAQNWYFDSFAELVSNGNKPIRGPMLVLQGTMDPIIDPMLTTEAVNQTCRAHPDSNLTFATFDGVAHVPVLNAGQQVWLKWIEDRFNGVESGGGCSTHHYQPPLPPTSYQTREQGYFMEYPLYQYEIS